MQDIKIENNSPVTFHVNESNNSDGIADFENVIKTAINKVDQLEKDADQSIVALLQGEGDVHETMLAIQKADISMRMLLTVRNKVIEAYREIMNMQF